MTDIWPEFNQATDMADPKFEVGMKFSDCKVFRVVVREQFVKRNRDVVFVRSETFKLKAVCADPDCPWEIYASKMQHEKTLQVKKYEGEHTCGIVWENPTVKCSWLSAKYMETLKSNPSWQVSSFMETVKKDYNSGVSRQQVYRAKERALWQIEGIYTEQYSRIWDYCEELRKTNPGTTTKGVYGGKFLAAVVIDANNETWEIAYAVVESECKDSWVWFLESLVQDVEIVNQFGYTFVLDKQKGLLPTFEQVVPNSEHRFCARHLFTNFILQFKGKALSDKFWGAAKATTVSQFARQMEELKNLDMDAYA
ncbi:PREDICTED: uncharacterized protein LOC107880361 [Prunus mume]|uniref:Uncharacterized protein LOC107880361 n=1 Tax=Prunus mume TaxID=102107 RepID=A0ABM1LIB6_PRUMU|nr:PREDICTED: uncharacterized protein LOC107880361 [Prunus mume]